MNIQKEKNTSRRKRRKQSKNNKKEIKKITEKGKTYKNRKHAHAHADIYIYDLYEKNWENTRRRSRLDIFS